MLISILALAALMTTQEPAPDREAEMTAELHARAIHRCETTPRGQGETVQACADRRVAALMGTYGTTAGALGATAGWLPNDETASGADLGFPTLDQATIDRGFELDTRTPAPRDRTYQPPQSRCRRETTRDADGQGASTILVCGNGGAAEQAVRQALGM